MNYDYFSRLEDGSLTKSETQSEQAFMEKTLAAVFSEKTEAMAGRINDMLAPRFSGCSAKTRSLSVSFDVQEWMLNPNGTLHGGVLSTAVDMVISVLSRFLAEKRLMVTAQLSMNFLRTIRSDDTFTVTVVADHVGRRSVIVHAWVNVSSSEKSAATATAVLM